jgi:hypothetical protein
MVQGRSMRIDTAEGAAFVFAIRPGSHRPRSVRKSSAEAARRNPKAAVYGRTLQVKHGFVERRAASVF